MKAMVLAAGFGERLLPLTLSVPKPAIPVLGRPIVLEVLRQLARSGITTVAVNLHHHAERLAALLTDSGVGLENLHLSREETILGTAGALRHAAGFLRGEGTFLVRNSDFLADIDIGKALAAHRAHAWAATLVLAPARPGYSEIAVDEQGSVLSLGRLPAAPRGRIAGRYLFTGFQILEEEVLERIPRRGASDIVKDVHRQLAAEGRLGSVVHPGFWWEFGSPDQYLEGSFRLMGLPAAVRTSMMETDPLRRVGGARIAIGPGADLHSGVRVRGHACVGFACLVAEGTTIEDSVILPEAWIGPGCHLRHAIVGPWTEVPAGFVVDGAIVFADPNPGSEPPAGTVRRDGLLIRRFEASES